MISIFSKCLKNISAFDETEIMRYSGMAGYDPHVRELNDECIKECKDIFEYRVCYTVLPVNINTDTVNIGDIEIASRSLSKNLSGCKNALVFAATVGVGIDRLTQKYSLISPSKAIMLQAIGAERIEALCDSFCRNIKKEYGELRPRFSCGYGDFSLSYQRDIFSLLNCEKHIGLTLNESLLMSPTKSVTAIAGIDC